MQSAPRARTARMPLLDLASQSHERARWPTASSWWAWLRCCQWPGIFAVVQGKFRSWPVLAAHYLHREVVRFRLRNAVTWPSSAPPLADGCTAIIGMCHRLPGVMLSNLKCLRAASWPELQHIVVAVDGPAGCVSDTLERQMLDLSTPELTIEIHYYSKEQAALATSLELPFVYSWMSWSIALAHCRTRYALVQDYDALVFGDTLRRRYEEMVRSGAAIQGIRWYQGNGIEPRDHLATTFEAFVDVAWLRAQPPLAAFHKVSFVDGASRDYDTMLHLQHVHTPAERRTTMAMPEESLVHPSQMIHQYTMFRRNPGAVQPCGSLPMIPLFEFLSGDAAAIGRAAGRLAGSSRKVYRFLGDDTDVNLTELKLAHVEWILKQMAHACLSMHVPPLGDVFLYGEALYEVIGVAAPGRWVGDFTGAQRSWLDECRRLAEHGEADAAPRAAAP